MRESFESDSQIARHGLSPTGSSYLFYGKLVEESGDVARMKRAYSQEERFLANVLRRTKRLYRKVETEKQT